MLSAKNVLHLAPMNPALHRSSLPSPIGVAIDFRAHADELNKASASWMQAAVFARLAPDALAITSPRGQRSFAQLHTNANRLAHALHARGLRSGDALALCCRNRPEFVEVLLAAMRLGLRLTPINVHLTAPELRYIVRDCGARWFVAERELGAPGLADDGVEEIVIDGDGDTGYAQVLATSSAADLPEPRAGTLMLYTSGTTGRPKGVFRREPECITPQFEGSFGNYQPGDVALCAGPAYHSAPLLFDIRWPLASGVPIVMMEKWDANTALALIASHRISHAHLVPTMFQRLLALPAAQRALHDVSSLRFVVHGAAPCTVAVKRQIIDWFGPVLTEYYAATEGGDGIHVNSVDWLAHPGTVGRVEPGSGNRILDDAGRDVAPGEVGRIYFQAPAQGRFEYFGDADKTAAAYAGERFTLGDMGYVDADGWLFLTGRAAECIISGGVNIYPSEVDEVLMRHPAVADVCTIGAPDDEWGEHVVAVVVLADGQLPNAEMTQTLIGHARQFLAAFKRPREIVFEAELPRSASGKLLRQQVRQRFWQGRERSI
jgi:long-chain acyl-CoA synthetase